jgi:hypothetical protein
MKAKILALRLGRRALAAAAVGDDDDLTMYDGRHLSSRAERAVAATERYLVRLFELSMPTIVMIDAPHAEGGTTSRLVEVATSVLQRLNIKFELVSLSDVLSSFALSGLRSRRELSQVVEAFWPVLQQMRLKVKPYVADAAAVALYADVWHGLGVADDR